MNYKDPEVYDDFKWGLKIDKDNLDDEIIRQPHDFYHVSEATALAKAHKDKLDHDFDVTVATLDRDVRKDMQAEEEKITEAQVKQRVVQDQVHIRAKTAVIDANYQEARWRALKDAYNQKADMLKLMVQLHNSNYFSDIKGAKERSEVHKGRQRERL